MKNLRILWWSIVIIFYKYIFDTQNILVKHRHAKKFKAQARKEKHQAKTKEMNEAILSLDTQISIAKNNKIEIQVLKNCQDKLKNKIKKSRQIIIDSNEIIISINSGSML